MSGNQLSLNEFELENMVKHTTIVVIAKRGSGKSVVVSDIMYHLRSIPCGIVIAPTDEVNGQYKKFFPDLFIHYQVTPEILGRLIFRQTMIIEKHKKYKKQGKYVDYRALLVMDDCLADNSNWKKIKEIRDIFMNGRHYKITYILTMQNPLGIGPDLRQNFDYFFLLKDDTMVNMKKLYTNYAGVFPTQNAFESVFRECTKDYKCMVIDNRSPADKLSDKVFWFKATHGRRFTFGSKTFKRQHKKFFDAEYQKKAMLAKYTLNNTKKNNVEVLLR